MDFLLFFEDQVDDLAGLAGAECPASDWRIWVGRMLGLAVPRCQLQHVEYPAKLASASSDKAATCSDTVVSGTMRYTYRPSRCWISACRSSHDAASGLLPVRLICSALVNSR